MSKVLIIGLPYFAKKLAVSLQDKNLKDIFIPLDTNRKFLDKVKYAFHVLNADVVYQIGGNAYLGGALKLAYSLKKRIVFHWVGTDVLMAKENVRLNTHNRAFLNYVEHLCEVQWIKDELREIEIDPQIMQIASFDQFTESTFTFPDKFSVLTYMTPGREEFYGINSIISLANEFPEVSIKILGISTYHKSLPGNVILGGWVSDMKKEYLGTCLYLRLPEHDGLSFSVLEAMSFGRYVGYSQKLEGTKHVNDFDGLINYVKELRLEHEVKGLMLNFEGINFIKNNFKKDEVLNHLSNYLLKKI